MTTPRLIALVVVAALAGCGPRTATVTGRVASQGRPVVWGTITLQAADGSMHQAGIEPDGRFTIPNVPAGAARVGVVSPKPSGGRGGREGSDSRVAAGPPEPPPGAWFPLPDKFADPNASGLTVQVDGGPVDIDLK
jgi:hypothetical protein